MRRLTALIKAIVPFPAEIREEFFKIVKVLDLMPGEWVPDDLSTGTLIFVEDGLLLLTRCKNKHWKCSNFYLEGTLAATWSEGAAEMKDDSFRVRAAEPTHIYYWTSDNARRVQDFFVSYNIVSHVLRQRSFFKSEQRKILFDLSPLERIMYVDTYFRSLMRAPFEDLSQFLCLKTKLEKGVLDTLQKESLSSQKQLS
jgi:hypothetical protein